MNTGDQGANGWAGVAVKLGLLPLLVESGPINGDVVESAVDRVRAINVPIVGHVMVSKT